MNTRAGCLLAALLTVLPFVGCATVKVRKVRVEDRLKGTDHDVRGFRYYLNRPYIAVTREVPVSSVYVPVELAVYPRTAMLVAGQTLPPGAEIVLVAQVPDGHGNYRVFDQRGHWRPDIDPSHVAYLSRTANSGNDLLKKDATNLARKKIEEVILTDADKHHRKKKNHQPLPDPDGLKAEIRAIITVSFPHSATENAVTKVLKVEIEKGVGKAKEHLMNKHQIKDYEPNINKMVEDVFNHIKTSGDSPVSDTRTFKLAGNKIEPCKDAIRTPPTDAEEKTKKPSFQVVFLPDFEEQYAIENINCLAKTKYKYTFRNGTELVHMAGTYNATDLPVAIVETLGKLIDAAGAVAKKRLQQPVSGAGFGARRKVSKAETFYIRIHHAIEPGMYRIQKSWERAAAAKLPQLSHQQITGLFSDIGLPVVRSISVLTPTQYTIANGRTPPPDPNAR